MKKSQREYYDKVASLGCVLCYHIGYRGTSAELHHVRRHGAPRETAPVIPLCPEHHRGNSGVHGMGKKGFAKQYGVDEDDLVRLTSALLELQ